MKKALKKIQRLLKNPVFQLVYKTQDGRTELYTIDKPDHEREFGNVAEGVKVAGFRAYCHNRNAYRSFRYDRVVALNRV